AAMPRDRRAAAASLCTREVALTQTPAPARWEPNGRFIETSSRRLHAFGGPSPVELLLLPTHSSASLWLFLTPTTGGSYASHAYLLCMPRGRTRALDPSPQGRSRCRSASYLDEHSGLSSASSRPFWPALGGYRRTARVRTRFCPFYHRCRPPLL